MTKKNVVFIIIMGILFPLFTFVPMVNAVESPNDFHVEANAALSVDTKTGKIFYDQNAETPLGIASITKLISLYIVEKEIAQGNLTWEEEVSISENVATISVDPELSNVPLETSGTYTVKELFDSALIQSANASTMALAEKIAGNEQNFVDKMRVQLEEFGITDAKIVNSSGLNNSFLGENRYPGTSAEDENLMSAKDVAIVARHLIQDFPDILKVSATTSQLFGENSNSPVEMTNWNWLLPGMANEKEGVDGLKTGTTDLAGACFVGTMVKEEQRIITVVLNATNHEQDHAARFKETARLMDYSYDNWKEEVVLKENQLLPDLSTISVSDGEEKTLPVSIDTDIKLWLRSDMTKDDVQYTIEPSGNKWQNDSLKAPLETNEKIATFQASVPKDTLGYLEGSDVNLTVFGSLQVDKGTRKDNLWRHSVRIVKSWWTKLSEKTRSIVNVSFFIIFLLGNKVQLLHF